MSLIDSEWELCKENLQPLKQGRKMDDIKSALNMKDKKEAQKREEIRNDFEAELRTYSGPDMLGVFCKYISWIEKSYPDGGQDGKLEAVLESCILENNVEANRQDPRFLDVCLKYIKFVLDPLEFFTFMSEQGIGTKHADFYVNWSWHHENCCNNQRAHEVLLRGLEFGATPKNVLENTQKGLQMRIAKGLAKRGNSSSDDEDQKREKLGGLKGRKKKSGKALAPTSRTGTSMKPTGLKSASNVPSGKVTVKIFCDENDECAASNQVVTETFNTQRGIENTRKPGKWNENKMKPLSVVEVPKPEFQILSGEESDSEVPVFKPPKEAYTLKVSDRRAKSPPLVRFEHLDAKKQRFFFDERKIYCGGTEFSFEEIRGRKWMAQKKKEDERKRMEELVNQLSAATSQRDAEREREQKERDEERKRNDALQLQVKILEQKIGLLLKHQDIKDKKDEVDSKGSHTNEQQKDKPKCKIESSKQMLTESTDSVSSNSHKVHSSKDMDASSFVRDCCWNGTLVPSSPIAKDVEKDFSIFKDQTVGPLVFQDGMKNVISNETQGFDQSTMYQGQFATDAFTMKLPTSVAEFTNFKHCASTPAANGKSERKMIKSESEGVKGGDAENVIVQKLSPIVECSREYKSSSSSSSSSAYTRSRNLF